MKEIKFFYSAGCPYCRQADKIMEKLIRENPDFSDVKICKIEENENKALADSYDYYYVPCLWVGDKKLHEGVPTEQKVKDAFLEALQVNYTK